MAKKIDINGLDHFKDKENAMIASEYSSSQTYAVGDYCYHAGTLYRCTTAIATAEAWTAGHWTAAKLADDTSELKTALNELEGSPVVEASVAANGVLDNKYNFEAGFYKFHATGNNISLRLHQTSTFNVNDPTNIDIASNYQSGDFDDYITVPSGYHYYRFYSGTVSGNLTIIKANGRIDAIEEELQTKKPKSFSKTFYPDDIQRGSFATSTGVFTPSATGTNYGSDYIECFENAPVQYVRNTTQATGAWYLRFYYYDKAKNFISTSDSYNMANVYDVSDVAPAKTSFVRIALAYVADLTYLAVPFTVNIGEIYDSEHDYFAYDKSVIVFAANDSTLADKMKADVVCDGVNDEIELQHAVDMLQANTRYNGGKIVLLNGTYIIDSLYDSENEDVGKIGICIKNNLAYSKYGSITIEGTTIPNLINNMQAGSCAVIKLSDTCFNALSNTEKVSIIGGLPVFEDSQPVYKACAGFWLIKNIAVLIQNPYKSVIGINAEWCWSLKLANIQFARTANAGKSQLAHEIVNANDECIGLRTLRGLNNGSGYLIENVNVRGWGTAFDISGEHMTMIGCCARINKTGFRFGYFDPVSSAHPNVLINCCDEVCINGIKLYGGTLHPTLEFISYNRELDSWVYEQDETEKIEYASLAWEEYPGNYYGTVTYAVDSAWNYVNQADQDFWDSGCGLNFKTINLLDKQSGATANRPTNPQRNQMYFDTTINKAIWFINNTWVDATGNQVT